MLPKEILEASGYTASKGALIAMTRELAVQQAEHGIRVNAIAPGFFRTRLSGGVLEHAQRTHRTPSRRWDEWVKRARLKGPIVFLASSASDYITGQIIAVDGGMTAA